MCLESFWALRRACWRISPGLGDPWSGGEGQGLKESNPLLVLGRDVGVLTQEGEGCFLMGPWSRHTLATCQWSDVGHLGKAGMGLRQVSIWNHWHLEPEQSCGPLLPLSPWSRVCEEAGSEGPGKRTWPWGLFVGAGPHAPGCPQGPDKAGNSCRKLRSKACQSQQPPVWSLQAGTGSWTFLHLTEHSVGGAEWAWGSPKGLGSHSHSVGWKVHGAGAGA